jgi:hypothetical protein
MGKSLKSHFLKHATFHFFPLSTLMPSLPLYTLMNHHLNLCYLLIVYVATFPDFIAGKLNFAKLRNTQMMLPLVDSPLLSGSYWKSLFTQHSEIS